VTFTLTGQESATAAVNGRPIVAVAVTSLAGDTVVHWNDPEPVSEADTLTRRRVAAVRPPWLDSMVRMLVARATATDSVPAPDRAAPEGRVRVAVLDSALAVESAVTAARERRTVAVLVPAAVNAAAPTATRNACVARVPAPVGELTAARDRCAAAVLVPAAESDASTNDVRFAATSIVPVSDSNALAARARRIPAV
jgi:hypothetical protein